MICSTCGATNRAGRKFGAQCASPLAVACPLCGASNEPEDRFCDECAVPLTQGVRPAAVPAATPAPVAERRLVSVGNWPRPAATLTPAAATRANHSLPPCPRGLLLSWRQRDLARTGTPRPLERSTECLWDQPWRQPERVQFKRPFRLL
ncbi:MAG TPA: zinc ribbon domain-containing protein [Coriobacteriia bacterium]